VGCSSFFPLCLSVPLGTERLVDADEARGGRGRKPRSRRLSVWWVGCGPSKGARWLGHCHSVGMHKSAAPSTVSSVHTLRVSQSLVSCRTGAAVAVTGGGAGRHLRRRWTEALGLADAARYQHAQAPGTAACQPAGQQMGCRGTRRRGPPGRPVTAPAWVRSTTDIACSLVSFPVSRAVVHEE
jgi:hypothetical protein